MISEIFQILAAFGNDAQATPRLRISDRYPDVSLRNQFGRELTFRRDFVADGRALIINSMYTTCRGSCPGTGATLEGLRKSLSPVFGKRLTLLSFTLEPRIDTPDVLLKYAQAFGAGRERTDLCDWHFLTGSAEAMDGLRRGLGFFDLDPRVDKDVSQHASTLLVGNSTTDRWAAMPSELRTPVLIESIRRVAGFTFEQKYGISP